MQPSDAKFATTGSDQIVHPQSRQQIRPNHGNEPPTNKFSGNTRSSSRKGIKLSWFGKKHKSKEDKFTRSPQNSVSSGSSQGDQSPKSPQNSSSSVSSETDGHWQTPHTQVPRGQVQEHDGDNLIDGTKKKFSGTPEYTNNQEKKMKWFTTQQNAHGDQLPGERQGEINANNSSQNENWQFSNTNITGPQIQPRNNINFGNGLKKKLSGTDGKGCEQENGNQGGVNIKNHQNNPIFNGAIGSGRGLATETHTSHSQVQHGNRYPDNSAAENFSGKGFNNDQNWKYENGFSKQPNFIGGQATNGYHVAETSYTPGIPVIKEKVCPQTGKIGKIPDSYILVTHITAKEHPEARTNSEAGTTAPKAATPPSSVVTVRNPGASSMETRNKSSSSPSVSYLIFNIKTLQRSQEKDSILFFFCICNKLLFRGDDKL